MPPSGNTAVDQYYAHSANAHGTWHRLAEHLSCVSKLAGEFLQGWKGAEEAALAGLLHDLGKYGDLFQARLRGEVQGLDHWSQGVWLNRFEHRPTCIEIVTTYDLVIFVWSLQYSMSIWRR